MGRHPRVDIGCGGRGGHGAVNDGNLSGTWKFFNTDGNITGIWNFTASSATVLGTNGNAQNELDNGDYIKISGSGTWFKVDGEPSGPNTINIIPAYPSWLTTDQNKVVGYWDASAHSEESPHIVSGTGGNAQNELNGGDFIRVDGASPPSWYEVDGEPSSANSIKLMTGFLENNTEGKTVNYFSISVHPPYTADYHYESLWFSAGIGNTVHHCLVENNIFVYGAAHDQLEFQTNGGTIEYNIVRNNIVRNPMHGVIGLYGSSGTGSDRNLIENNIIYEGGDDCSLNNCYENLWGSSKDRNAARWQHNGLQLYGHYNIVRKNIIYSNGLGNNLDANSENNRIYNNVLYNNVRGWLLNVAGRSVNGNVFKNNIVKDNNKPGGGTYANYPLYVALDTSPCANEWAYNNFDDVNNIRYGDCTGSYNGELSNLQATIPAKFHNNLKNESGFVNASGHDFRLKSNSPMIDAGGFLTCTKGSGNNSSIIIVKDATYFMDGWDLIAGDSIQLEGSIQTARITNVDYTNNIITVDSPLTWDDNQGVSLVYKGSAPDIGESEYVSGADTTPPAAPSGFTVNKF